MLFYCIIIILYVLGISVEATQPIPVPGFVSWLQPWASGVARRFGVLMISGNHLARHVVHFGVALSCSGRCATSRWTSFWWGVSGAEMVGALMILILRRFGWRSRIWASTQVLQLSVYLQNTNSKGAHCAQDIPRLLELNHLHQPECIRLTGHPDIPSPGGFIHRGGWLQILGIVSRRLDATRRPAVSSYVQRVAIRQAAAGSSAMHGWWPQLWLQIHGQSMVTCDMSWQLVVG